MRVKTLAASVAVLASFASVAQAPGARAVRPYIPRIPSGVMETDTFRSVRMTIDGADALLYQPKRLAENGAVAVVYANRGFGFGPPAIELARRGYRVLHVSAPFTGPVEVMAPTPYEDFQQVSAGIRYLRRLPGVRHVVVAGWGAGASTITLYTAIAEKGPIACQNKSILYPCSTAEASGLAKPDGLILFDTGFGSGVKAAAIDPGRPGLDSHSPADGYDPVTDTARYPAEFRRRYFGAQAARYGEIVDAALARLAALGGPAGTRDEKMAAGAVPTVTALYGTDLSLLSHTKRPHLLLRADGTTGMEILRSVRPTASELPGPPPPKPNQAPPPPRMQSIREFLVNNAIRTTPDFAITEDDVHGVDWGTSVLGTPAQAEDVTVPALLVTNTCFMFVVSAEIVLDHLASRDKTQVGVEGSGHEFEPCKPGYGDTKKRLFDYAASWLGKPGRF